ncbi:MAG: hypothetical protein GKR87_13160 [Kiritimatiellae bacterium]|nr:hypothetical protein [Kiritimatiellia bacterium]
MVEFSLPTNVLGGLEKELGEKVPGARIAGPVDLMEAIEDGAEGVGSFEMISAVLSDEREGGFTRSVVSSGKAPLLPGSKAAVAALLNQEGATLLWDSFKGPASDVSISVHAYYEAKVKAYNAKVTADSSTIYTHFSEITNSQDRYTKH